MRVILGRTLLGVGLTFMLIAFGSAFAACWVQDMDTVRSLVGQAFVSSLALIAFVALGLAVLDE